MPLRRPARREPPTSRAPPSSRLRPATPARSVRGRRGSRPDVAASVDTCRARASASPIPISSASTRATRPVARVASALRRAGRPATACRADGPAVSAAPRSPAVTGAAPSGDDPLQPAKGAAAATRASSAGDAGRQASPAQRRGQERRRRGSARRRDRDGADDDVRSPCPAAQRDLERDDGVQGRAGLGLPRRARRRPGVLAAATRRAARRAPPSPGPSAATSNGPALRPMRTMREAGARPRALPASAAASLVLTPARASSSLVVWVAVLVTATLIVLRFLVFVHYEQADFDADQAIVGLMATHLAEGRAWPLFFYGQLYMMGVQAWMAALRLPADGAHGVRAEAAAAWSSTSRPVGCWCGCWCASRACGPGRRRRLPRGSRCFRRSRPAAWSRRRAAPSSRCSTRCCCGSRGGAP